MREDGCGHVTDLTMVSPGSTHMCTSRTRSHHIFQKPSHQTLEVHNMSNSSDVNDRLDEMQASGDAAKQALLAIYQAGKPDNLFHIRAPSTAALESMLTVLANNAAQTTYCHNHDGQLQGGKPVHCQHVSCSRKPGDYPITPSLCRRVTTPPRMVMPSNFVPGNSEAKPVKVNIECAPNTDTVVSFRVRSVPA